MFSVHNIYVNLAPSFSIYTAKKLINCTKKSQDFVTIFSYTFPSECHNDSPRKRMHTFSFTQKVVNIRCQMDEIINASILKNKRKYIIYRDIAKKGKNNPICSCIITISWKYWATQIFV